MTTEDPAPEASWSRVDDGKHDARTRADELTGDQLRAGAQRLRATVRRVRPEVVTVLGLTAYRRAFDRPRATAGRQPEDIEGAQLWVAPNPSGLNAHETVASLAAAYRRVGVAAGLLPDGEQPA